MRDVVIKERQIYWVSEVDEDGEEKQVPKSLDSLLPIDRVVTIDNNGYVYLYDTCVAVTEDMIERAL